jgi:NADH-quinone oxidoreductase subunit C
MDAAPIPEVIARAVPGASIEAPPPSDGMETIVVDAAHLVEVCRALRDLPELQFAFLAEVTAVDRWPVEPRYEVVYHLACLGDDYRVPEAGGGAAPARRLRVRVVLTGEAAEVPTVTGIWPAANWLEREVFDLFGIAFTGHPDLRRVLMPDDWVGYPLRKDYPVQIKKETASWSPLELSAEEFAANIRARQALAKEQAAPRADRE